MNAPDLAKFAGCVAFVIASAATARAATIVVNDTSGGTGGPGCKLRDAVTAANTDTATGGCAAGSGPDTIQLAPGATYTLTVVDNGAGVNLNGLPAITSSITITGLDTLIARDSVSSFRFFTVTTSGSLTLTGLTLQNGRAPSGGSASKGGDGGALASAGRIALFHTNIVSNSAGSGGAGVGISGGNGGRGGGVFLSAGTAILSQTQFFGNAAGNGGGSNLINGGGDGGSGGALHQAAGLLIVEASTVAFNKSGSRGGSGAPVAGSGGGMFIDAAAFITNTTVSSNTTGAGGIPTGGGIHNAGILSLTHATIYENKAGDGGGVFLAGGSTLAHRNSVIANSSAGGDCAGTGGISGSNSKTGDGSCSLPAIDPQLFPLGDYGGPTLTHLPQPTSPLRGAALSLCAARDQRGVARGAAPCDVGAVEAVELCFATPDDGATLFVDATAKAVQDAVFAAPSGGIVKVSGTCQGASVHGGGTQVVLVDKALTLVGGYSPLDWTATPSAALTTTLDALSAGRVISAMQPLTVSHLTVRNGDVSTLGSGVFAGSSLTLLRARVADNLTSAGGGGAHVAGPLRMTDSIFLNNHSNGNGGGINAMGPTLIINSVFQNNDSAGNFGGGLRIVTATRVVASQFLSNTAVQGGAIGSIATASILHVEDSVFLNNRATSSGADGGGAVSTSGRSYFTRTAFIRNHAATAGGAVRASRDLIILNSLFAANSAGLGGNAVSVSLGAGDTYMLLNNTIASPTLAAGSAISVTGHTVVISNTIIASHTVGVLGSTSTDFIHDYNLFFGVPTTITGGTSSGGANDVGGDPGFVNPIGDDYHLRRFSPAINAGFDFGLRDDFDGDPRPIAAKTDIGFDEFVFARVFVPSTMRAFGEDW